jgi:hypothetical protein
VRPVSDRRRSPDLLALEVTVAVNLDVGHRYLVARRVC